MVTLKSTRDGFGEGIAIAARKDKRVVALSADLSESTRLEHFSRIFQKRYFEVGVAEQNMACVAAGLAHVGKIPFITSFAVFSPGRNWEQIRTTICYNNENVKIVGSHAGLGVGPDGATHQALEDIALMRVLPNMIVVVPCDAIQARKATLALAKLKGPAYLRVCRQAGEVLTDDRTPFKIGTANVLRKGRDITIIGCGPVLSLAIDAMILLKTKGITATIIDCHTIKPLDEKTLIESARKTGRVITIEDHQVAGGLGGAVAELLSEEFPVHIERMGVVDSFGESGSAEEVYRRHGLTAVNIARVAEKLCKRKI